MMIRQFSVRFPEGSGSVIQRGAAMPMVLAAAISFLVVGFGGGAALAQTPSNDTCQTARTIKLGRHSFSNVGGNIAPPAMCQTAGCDVWFKFNSTFTGNLVISTCGDANFDTIIAAYSGCSCGTFTLLGCNDDTSGCGGNTSRLIIPVQAGNCYRIRVAAFNGLCGTGALTLSIEDPENAGTADRIRDGAAAGDFFGYDVAGNGHINSDVVEDVLVGSPRNNFGGADAGRAFAYRGANNALLYTKTGAAAGDNFGWSVALTDANDDGLDDLVIGAPWHDSNGANAGRVYVYSGANGALLWSRKGVASGDRFGYSVAAAGDFNLDGFDDVIVGAPYNDQFGTNAGRAYIFSGQNGATLKIFNGQSAGELFGWAVAGLGDFNNDSKWEVAVGAPKNDAGGADAGRVSIFSGGTGSPLIRINGDDPSDQFGFSIAGRRFSFGSNYGLMVVGSPYNDAVANNGGRAKVFIRNISAPNTSGCSNFICPLYTLNGANPGDNFGWSVALNDLVGTEFFDFVVGAPRADLNGPDSGAVYIFDGASGLLVRRFYGEASGDQFGFSIDAAGDFNNDTRQDLIVGAPMNDAKASSAGRAYIYFNDDSPGFGNQPPQSAAGASMIASGDADIDGDGMVGGADLTALLTAWGPCDPGAAEECPADVNQDGHVNVEDLLSVLAAWQ